MPAYGKLHSKTIVAHCGRCGYVRESDLKRGKRGDFRCCFCGQQVRTKPQPSRMNLNAKRQLQREMAKHE